MVQMDKLVLGFIADILYMKGVICYDEFEAIMDVRTPKDLQTVTDKILNEEYNPNKRGEAYVGYGK